MKGPVSSAGQEDERGPIVIASMACRFPEADSPDELWSNVLAGRASFRSIPKERLPLAAYAANATDPSESITPILAGLIRDWHFDRQRHRIPADSYEMTDLSHWLALDVALDAANALGGPDALPRDRCGVVVANTLTGEFSRANSLRLRLPFMERHLAEALAAEGLTGEAADRVREGFSARVRERLTAPGTDSLAGGLANTIAGRIANCFDLHGGAYSIDGACSSSLLAVMNACGQLRSGAWDCAVVGAVDLSLDPFELVGFSRLGALAAEEMRVFDRRASGFWPGEGCGVAILAFESEAQRRGWPVMARLLGWGMSSDGAGGLTRPDARGQTLAVRRAYAHARIDPASIGFVEAHGTGTAVGDPTEIRALAAAFRDRPDPVFIGSIKGNIGHCKAAAGFAGLLKAVHAVRDGLVPPHLGCEEPHPVFAEVGGRVAATGEAAAWPMKGERRAGVSSFGFGGINVHLVVEAPPDIPAMAPPAWRHQVEELFVFSAPSREGLSQRLERFAEAVTSLSIAELRDAAASLIGDAQGGPWRAAFAAGRPDKAADLAAASGRALRADVPALDGGAGFFCGKIGTPPKIGFVFPGQAAPLPLGGGAWARRFGAFFQEDRGAGNAQDGSTEKAQPAIIAGSLSGLRVLKAFGVEATVAFGHSLGELAALSWAGALGAEDTVELASLRGRLMQRHGEAGGAMGRIALPPSDALALHPEGALTAACLNGAAETVLSGPAGPLNTALAAAKAIGVEAASLPVRHAFHSPMMAPVLGPWRDALTAIGLTVPQRRMISTVTGRAIGDADDLHELLARQLTAPVLFTDALVCARAEADLFIEVGGGQGMARLAKLAGAECLSIDAGGATLRPLLETLGSLFVRGVTLALAPLFEDRALRSIDLEKRPVLLSNPCGEAAGAAPLSPARRQPAASAEGEGRLPTIAGGEGAEALVFACVSELTGLPAPSLSRDDRFLDDLHLNSLAVARLVSEIARATDLPPPAGATEFANATIGDLIEAAVKWSAETPEDRATEDKTVAGAASWIRHYAFRWENAGPEFFEGPGPSGEDVPGWRLASGAAPVFAALCAGLSQGSDGVIVGLSAGAAEAEPAALLERCQAAAAQEARHLVILHDGAPLQGFARSLSAEGVFRSVTLIECPEPTPAAAKSIETLLRSPPPQFRERHIGPTGLMRRAVFAPLEKSAALAKPALARDSVLLVTGGAKGIGAECALRLAEKTGAALLLMGRSPAEDETVRQTLDRCRASGLTAHYERADLCDAQATARALARAQAALGPVSAILHAAGVNHPRPFRDLTAEAVEATIAPKLGGLNNVLAAIDDGQLRLLIGFGSIIGRIGLPGEAHYALANGFLTGRIDEIARRLRACHCLCLEWSVWSGAGMGERLGVMSDLERRGVRGLSLDAALDELEEIVLRDAVSGTFAVTDRFGPPREIDLGDAPIPMLRFLENVPVHFPGVEIVTECTLSLGSDPYLGDHAVEGVPVFPAVMGLEAMAQAASCLLPAAPRRFSDVHFDRALMLHEGALTIRVAALRRGDEVDVVIRAGDDGFVSDRMRATCSVSVPATRPAASAPVPFDTQDTDETAAGLYGPLLFQTGRFARLRAYASLAARAVIARLGPDEGRSWFGSYQPQTRLLGDPGARDALLHALQPAVPHRLVLPVFADEIVLSPGGSAQRTVRGRETASGDGSYTFDIEAYDEVGALVESWSGARFRSAGHHRVPLLPRLTLAAFLERRAEELLGRKDIRAFLTDKGDRRSRRDRAIAAAGVEGAVVTRTDGRPVLMGRAGAVSLAHGGDCTLLVLCEGGALLGCDLETAGNGEAAIAALSSEDTRIARALASGEDPGTASLVVFCAREAARKAGLSPSTPLFLASEDKDGWRVFGAGELRVASGPLGADFVAALSVSSVQRIRDLRAEGGVVAPSDPVLVPVGVEEGSS